MTVNKIQKYLYDLLQSQNTENFQQLKGIFNYVKKDVLFPYIFISINNLEDLSTFSQKIYSCNFSINIFDKDTSNKFILNISEEIKETITNSQEIFVSINDFEIIDIKFSNLNIRLEEKNTIWKGELLYQMVIKK